MPDIETFEKISDLFKQLGDPTRMRIFWILCHHEECVIHISARMDMNGEVPPSRNSSPAC